MLTWIKRKRGQKGFTLIELIVVITILGILALIAIPRLGAFRAEAQAAALATNQRIARGAAAMWLAEHGNPPANVDWAWNSTGDPDGDWVDYLESWPGGEAMGIDVTIEPDGDILVDGLDGGGGGGTPTPPAYMVGFAVTAGTGSAGLTPAFVAPPASGAESYTVSVPNQGTPTNYVASYTSTVPSGALVAWSPDPGGTDNSRTIAGSVASYTVTVTAIGYAPTVYTFTNQQGAAPPTAYLTNFTVSGDEASLSATFSQTTYGYAVVLPWYWDTEGTNQDDYNATATTSLAGATIVWSFGSSTPVTSPSIRQVPNETTFTYTVTVSAPGYTPQPYSFAHQLAAQPKALLTSFTVTDKHDATNPAEVLVTLVPDGTVSFSVPHESGGSDRHYYDVTIVVPSGVQVEWSFGTHPNHHNLSQVIDKTWDNYHIHVTGTGLAETVYTFDHINNTGY